MSRYAVIWLTGAEQEARRLLAKSRLTSALREAFRQIDEQLALQPRSGTLLHEGLWRLDLPLLTAYYAVNEDLQRVEVAEIKSLV